MQVTTSGGTVTFSEKDRGNFSIGLHKTLRLPEDGKTHALPPSLGLFPIKRVDDYLSRVPASWKEHGGVFIPLWQREALWLSFASNGSPCAVKVAAGKINAVSGKPWEAGMVAGVEDYMVAPPQPWLDGFNAGAGLIKQFVAMPMGMGYTVEKQVTGEEKHGGLQILVIPAKPGAIPKPDYRFLRGVNLSGVAHDGAATMDYMDQGNVWSAGLTPTGSGPWGGGGMSFGSSSISCNSAGMSGGAVGVYNVSQVFDGAPVHKGAEMGLGAGGSMRQQIYPDPHGLDVWDQGAAGRIFIHLVNAEMYEQITGEKPPKSPVTAQAYTQAGLPWFDLNDGHMGDVQAPDALVKVKTVGQIDKDKSIEGQQDDAPVNETNVVKYGIGNPATHVRTGSW
jgi:hypothetical protein